MSNATVAKEHRKQPNKFLVIGSALTLIFILLLLFTPKIKHLGSYDFEELSPAVSRYPNFYALMIEPQDFELDQQQAVLSAAADLAHKLQVENFILIHQESVTFNPAAFNLWATAFNIRGQNATITTTPDRSGSRSGHFAIVFLYNIEGEASEFAYHSSQVEAQYRRHNVQEVRSTLQHAWQAPLLSSPDLRIEARLRLTFDSSLNESVNVLTFQNNDSKRWPFLLALDTSNQEALAHGFPYFIVLEASISGEMKAMQVRTRYLQSAELPDDLYRRGYRSFMIMQTQN